MRPPLTRFPSLAVLPCLLLVALLAGCRNDDALTEVRDQQRQILAKLTSLEEKVEKSAARPAAPPRPSGPDPTRAYNLPAGQSASKGPADAPLTIVEFSDYQCPFCARSEPLVKELLAAYPTQTRLVFKHFPLTSIHPQAMPAALAAAAAQKQGKFWEMHEILFANQRALSPEQIRQYAKQIGLDLARFDADLQSDEVKTAVQEDMQLAQRVGVRGTPTLFVNGKLIQNRSVDGYKQIVEPMLRDRGTGPTPAQQAGG
jgi:protein-disulfide isomerase